MTQSETIRRRVPRLSGFALILIATVVSGVAAYVVTWVVPRNVGFANYSIFAIFWAALYLVVGALSGVQQEMTRATHPIAARVGRQHHGALRFSLAAALIVVALVLGSAPLWVNAVFPAEGWNLVWPLAAGTASYVLVAALSGSLYGVSKWLPLASMMIADAVLRLAAVLVVLLFTSDIVALAWAVALPFPGALIILWPFIRRSIVGRSSLDAGYRAITWNVLRTVVAAASTGAMVSGLPLLLGLTSHGVAKSVVGLYILTITLSRAPLIVVALSLQSYFTVTFRDKAHAFWPTFLRLQGAVALGGVVLAILGLILGPPVFRLLFPGQLEPAGWFIAVLVISSALMGSLFISAPALLARSHHLVYTLGWVAGALTTVVILVLPFDFTARVVTALLVGPAVGLLVHGGYLLRDTHRGRVTS